MPIVLSQDEAVSLINSAKNLFHRAILMTVYSTGMRRAEVCQLKVDDIDIQRGSCGVEFTGTGTFSVGDWALAMDKTCEVAQLSAPG